MQWPQQTIESSATNGMIAHQQLHLQEQHEHEEQQLLRQEQQRGQEQHNPVVHLGGEFQCSLIPDSVNIPALVASIARQRTAENVDEAFYVVNAGQILGQHRRWRSLLPRVFPYYAVKCNDNTFMIQLLAKLGANFDCASKKEIETVMSLGVSADRIIFANPCKMASHIRYAAERGVATMTFDNETELYKISKLYPDAKMVLRIAVSDPTAQCQLNLKFGAEPVQDAPALLKLASILNVQVVGISFHVGSGCRDPTAYYVALGHARRLTDLGRSIGHSMEMVDLGGGYPGYDTEEITFSRIASVINRSLEEFFPDENDVRVIAEPGRYYATAAWTLCVGIMAKTAVAASKISKDALEGETGYMYYVNDGVYGSFNCILYDHLTPTGQPVNEDAEAAMSWCNIWGPTCDSMDLITPKARMPTMAVGDWVRYDNMGAYTVAAACEFNGFPKPDIHYVIHESEWLGLKEELFASIRVDAAEVSQLLLLQKVGQVLEETAADEVPPVDDGWASVAESVTSDYDTSGSLTPALILSEIEDVEYDPNTALVA